MRISAGGHGRPRADGGKALHDGDAFGGGDNALLEGDNGEPAEPRACSSSPGSSRKSGFAGRPYASLPRAKVS